MNIHDYSLIPKGTLEAIQYYIDHGLEPGHFVSAVLKNDLREAVGRADAYNIQVIPHIVSWLYNEAPSNCWGSEEAFIAWMEHKR